MPIPQTKGETGCLGKCGYWRLLKEAGRGAYGVVYLAEGPDGRRAAVKVCRKDGCAPDRYSRELRGAECCKSLSGADGLVRMLELAETDWGFYAVMDLADDEFDRENASPESYRPKTLASVIDGEKALPLKVCVKLGIALAKGLAALQRRHLLHRDIKPGNVIYVGGEPVLSDTGLVVEETVAVSTVGTPGYVPPEKKFTDPASDIYSLGVTLKAASFGRRVEDLDKGPALEADTGAKMFPEWWKILNKATDPVPSRRYQSAKALLKDLKRLRARRAFPSKIAVLSAVATVCLAAVAAVAFSARGLAVSTQGNLDRKERRERDYIEHEKENAEREIAAVLKDAGLEIGAVLKDAGLATGAIGADGHGVKAEEIKSEIKSLEKADEKKDAIDAIEKLRRFSSNIESDIAEIERVDKPAADSLRARLDKIFASYKETEQLFEKTKEMCREIEEKETKGINIKDEYWRTRHVLTDVCNMYYSVYRQTEDFYSDRKSLLEKTRNRWEWYFEPVDVMKQVYWTERSDYDRHPFTDWNKGDFLRTCIEKIALTDKAKADELQQLLDKIAKVLEKIRSINDEIDKLRAEGKRKAEKGIDDMEEFRKAWRLYEEELGLVQKVLPDARKLKALHKQYAKEYIDDYL